MNTAPHAPAAADRPILADESTALAMAAASPGLRVEIFEPDWSAVDRARARVSASGLAHRVGIHHLHAYLCPLVRLALRRARATVVFVTAP